MMKKVIQVVMHVPFEDAGNIARWAEKNDFLLNCTHLYEGDILPPIGSFDMVAVMGGPMNIYNSEFYPWLKVEKVWLGRVIAADIPVVGVCLGAQLLADVLGGRVEENNYKEIGAFEVRKLPTGECDSFFAELPDKFIAFHWHGDRFILPDYVTLLAESDACRYQAFQYKNHVLGLQFHFDYTVESLEKMFEFCGDELFCEGEFVQTKEEILSAAEHIIKAQRYLDLLLDKLYYGNK